MNQKLVPDPFFVFLNSPKQPIHARHSFENKTFLKEDYQKSFTEFKTLKLKSFKLEFFHCTQSLFTDRMNNKWGLELVTGLSLGCKTSLEYSFFSDLSPG